MSLPSVDERVLSLELQDDQHDDVAEDAERRKRLATLKACLALRGFELHETKTGIVITKWGLARHVVDVDGGEAFLRQVGVPR